MTLRLRHDRPINRNQDGLDLSVNPCPTIMRAGISCIDHSYRLGEDNEDNEDGEVVNMQNKPPYVIPSMSEIRAMPWNGFNVVSTFSGAGGSCVGYRMAGFRVIWANEIVESAQEIYKANSAEDSYLCCRDIKTIQADDILTTTGLKVGELDLFDGSPPCQMFSTAGTREKGWNKEKIYAGVNQCNEKLFYEYIRLLRGLMPRVFVAENVSGLVKGSAKGYFIDILKELKASGYRVLCKILDAQWLGVPQHRERVIFIGVREDLGIDPIHPKPLPYRYSVTDALYNIIDIRQSAYGGKEKRSVKGKPSPTINAIGLGCVFAKDALADELKDGFIIPRQLRIEEVKMICSFPDDFILKGTYRQQWACLGNSVPPVMMKHISEIIRDKILSVNNANARRT